MEIERKYLVKKIPADLNCYQKLEIEQGYLNRSPVLRVRKSNDKYILTYKSKRNRTESGDAAIISEEIEVELTKEAYQHLSAKADNYMISKSRYLIPLWDGLKAELDVFHGRLEGLVFLEVEFPTEEAAASFRPPEWFGRDVSFEREYRNGYLSTVDCYCKPKEEED